MTQIGFHASHEQIAPGRLVTLAKLAEAVGFDAVKSSDHFHPWSERQGQSGFAWTWLGAAMQATALPFGIISAPGYRYHPAVLAQAAATVGEMFPGRFWLALGSGQAVNEAMTGLPWPEKAERNRRLAECAAVMKALLAGEEVTHRGRITVIEARLYTRPSVPVPIFGAAVTPRSAAEVAAWAEGLLTVGGKPEDVECVVTAYREAGGRGPVHLQHALSWAATEDEALAQGMDQWAPAVAGGEIAWDLRRPADFDRFGSFVNEEALRQSVTVSADLQRHVDHIARLMPLGDVVHLHCVGQNQEAFLDAFGRVVLPALR